MLIDLQRSFSEYASASADVQDEDWGAFFGLRKGGHAWSDLHERPLVVVLGEAGIGKTIEFKQEVARLTAEGKAAFFLPLNQLTEHASLDAEQDAIRTVAELKAIGSPFQSEPRTESQLYEQVLARLEELRKNLEEGPFSERDLFSPGIPEKFLQRWLASKFRETQNRRFSVHREEEVDDDKKTDIQLSCPAGSVCVEIKPVDSTRSYSANSLIDTLRTQIVGQYLRGTNSTRGILVLIQLDNKSWSIPGAATGLAFPALVSYLEDQAQAIKAVSGGVNELTVFGIRCVV